MALTIRSVLNVVKLAAPLVGQVGRLFGKKGSTVVKVADAVEGTLDRNPKKFLGALVVVLVGIGEFFWPGQTAAVIGFVQEYGGQLLEALAEKP